MKIDKICSLALTCLLLLLTGLGFECSPRPAPLAPFVISPKAGSRMRACDRAFRVVPPPRVDVQGVSATLNGDPLSSCSRVPPGSPSTSSIWRPRLSPRTRVTAPVRKVATGSE